MKYIKVGTWLKYTIRPAVWLYDKIWGSDLMQCEVCAERERVLNEKFQNLLRKLLTRS